MTTDPQRTSAHRFRLLAPALILVLAATLSLIGLGSPSHPLTVDEGYNGVDALRAMHGAPELFFAANNGREPLYILLAALTTSLFGPSAFALRLPAAIAGVLRVAVVYGLVRTVLADDGDDKARFVGLAAALTASASLWGVTISRLALRVGLLPLLVAASVWLLWWALRDGATGGAGREAPRRRLGRGLAFASAGVAAGLTVYTYVAWRMLPVLMAAVLPHLAWRRRSWIRGGWAGLLLAVLMAAVTASPMLAYYRDHPAAVNLRVAQVSAFGSDRSEHDSAFLVARNVVRTAAMFVWRGDPYDLYNVDSRPVFPAVVALFFALGVVVALRRWRDPAYGLWLWWVMLFALPGVLSDRTPHFARQVGVLPAVYVLPALGLWAAWTRLVGPIASTGSRIAVEATGKRARRRAVAAACICVYAFGAVAPTVRDTFFGLHGADLTPVDVLSALPERERLIVAGSEQTVSVGTYLAGASDRFAATHGFSAVLLPWGPDPNVIWLIEQDWYAERATRSVGAFFHLEEWREGPTPAGFRAFRATETSARSPMQPTPYVRTDLGSRLLAYELPPSAGPGETTTLALLWTVDATPVDDPGEDYTWFVHLIDDEHRVVAQMDWLGYPTYQWRAGDRVLSWYDLTIDPDVACETVHIELGMYSRASGRRVGLVWVPPAAGSDAPTAAMSRDDRAVFGDLALRCGTKSSTDMPTDPRSAPPNPSVKRVAVRNGPW